MAFARGVYPIGGVLATGQGLVLNSAMHLIAICRAGRPGLWLALAVLLSTGSAIAQDDSPAGAAGTESSEVSSGLYTTRMEDGTHSTKVGRTPMYGAAEAPGGGGPMSGEKGLSRTSGDLGRATAYADYGLTTRSGAATGTTAGQAQGAKPAVAPAREATQALIRSETNGLPLGQPGAGTAVGTPKASEGGKQQPAATPGGATGNR